MNKHILLLLFLMSTTLCSYATQSIAIRTVAQNWPIREVPTDYMGYASSAYTDEVKLAYECQGKGRCAEYDDVELTLHYSGFVCKPQTIVLNPAEHMMRIPSQRSGCCLNEVQLSYQGKTYFQKIKGCPPNMILNISFEVYHSAYGIERTPSVDIQ